MVTLHLPSLCKPPRLISTGSESVTGIRPIVHGHHPNFFRRRASRTGKCTHPYTSFVLNTHPRMDAGLSLANWCWRLRCRFCTVRCGPGTPCGIAWNGLFVLPTIVARSSLFKHRPQRRRLTLFGDGVLESGGDEGTVLNKISHHRPYSFFVGGPMRVKILKVDVLANYCTLRAG